MKLFSVLSVLVLGGLAMGSSDVHGATLPPPTRPSPRPPRREGHRGRRRAQDEPRHHRLPLQREGRAEPRRQLQEAGEREVLRRHDVPPRHPELHDPGRRPELEGRRSRATTALGGSGKNINAEFNANKHLRGTVSMARAQDPNSASSQFFICVKPAAVARRQVLGLRPGHRGHGRGRQDRGRAARRARQPDRQGRDGEGDDREAQDSSRATNRLAGCNRGPRSLRSGAARFPPERALSPRAPTG